MTFRVCLGLCMLLGMREGVITHAQAPLPPPVPPPAQGGALPAPVAPPAPGGTLPSPVTPPAPGSLPTVPLVAPTVQDAGSIQKSALVVPLLIRQMLDGKLTPEKAWESGALTLDDLLYVFEKYIDDWGGLNGKRDAKLRQALAGLLLKHATERFEKEKLSQVPPRVRLWLGDYYQAHKDPRAVEVLESILADIKAPVKGESPLVFQTLERLAWYYRDKGDFERGAQTWLRMAHYHADVGWWRPDAIVEAARLYMQANDARTAQGLYAKVPQYGNGWFTGLALFDQAEQLIAQGKHEEAHKLLRQPILGQGAEEIRVAVLSLLGLSYYRIGEFEAARQYSEQALAQYNLIVDRTMNLRLAGAANKAQSCLRWIEQWMKRPAEPIVCEPRRLTIIVSPDNKSQKSIRRQVLIRSFQPIPVTIDSSDIRLKVLTINNPQAIDREFYFQNEIMIEVAPDTIHDNLNATLLVRSPQTTDFVARLPVYLRVELSK